MSSYLLLKSLHFLGIILFLGNIIVTALWKIMADKTKSPKIVSYAQRLVTISDFTFTTIGVVLIIITGTMMSTNIGKFSELNWLSWGLWLFIASGLIWFIVLIPIQIKQANMARVFTWSNEIPQQYWTLSKLWTIFGIISTLLPLANLYFMVFKPL